MVAVPQLGLVSGNTLPSSAPHEVTRGVTGWDLLAPVLVEFQLNICFPA